MKRTYEFLKMVALGVTFHLCSLLLGLTEDDPTPRLVKPFYSCLPATIVRFS